MKEFSEGLYAYLEKINSGKDLVINNLSSFFFSYVPIDDNNRIMKTDFP